MTDPCAPVRRGGRGLKADVVCLSRGDPTALQTQLSFENDEREPLLFWRPGEYEVGGVFMRAIAANGGAQSGVAWLFHFGDVNLLHPGALGQAPERSELEALGEVHVLLAPLGAGRLTTEQASGLVTLLEPRNVLPVCHGAGDEAAALSGAFANALGADPPEEEEYLRVTAGNLPQQTRVVLLRPRALPD